MILLGLPLALPLAVLSFIGGFIPYVGPFVTTGAAFLVTVAAGSPIDVAVMLVFTIIFNVVQGNVVAPIVYGRRGQPAPRRRADGDPGRQRDRRRHRDVPRRAGRGGRGGDLAHGPAGLPVDARSVAGLSRVRSGARTRQNVVESAVGRGRSDSDSVGGEWTGIARGRPVVGSAVAPRHRGQPARLGRVPAPRDPVPRPGHRPRDLQPDGRPARRGRRGQPLRERPVPRLSACPR